MSILRPFLTPYRAASVEFQQPVKGLGMEASFTSAPGAYHFNLHSTRRLTNRLIPDSACIFVPLQGVETTHSQLCTDFHNAEEGQKDPLRWYKAIWKSPNIWHTTRRAAHIGLLVICLGLLACDAQEKPTVSLYLATQRGDLDQLERHLHWQSAINQPFPDGNYPLHSVAAQGRISLLQALLSHQAKLEVRNALERTPLEVAILTGHTQAADLFIAAGANLSATALLIIAATENTQDRDIVRYLVQHGANLEVKNSAGDTALLIAIRQQNHRLVAHLLAQGANVNAHDADGHSALQLAQAQPTIQQSLRRYGARE